MNGFEILLLCGAIVFVLLLLVGLFVPGGASAPQWRPEFGADGTPDRPFVPKVSGPGIAIDDDHGWLWVATDEHGYKLIDRADIRTWNHEWIERSTGRGIQQLHNKIVIGLTDLGTPVVKVSFGRDYLVAEQWHARLSAWLK